MKDKRFRTRELIHEIFVCKPVFPSILIAKILIKTNQITIMLMFNTEYNTLFDFVFLHLKKKDSYVMIKLDESLYFRFNECFMVSAISGIVQINNVYIFYALELFIFTFPSVFVHDTCATTNWFCNVRLIEFINDYLLSNLKIAETAINISNKGPFFKYYEVIKYAWA